MHANIIYILWSIYSGVILLVFFLKVSMYIQLTNNLLTQIRFDHFGTRLNRVSIISHTIFNTIINQSTNKSILMGLPV